MEASGPRPTESPEPGPAPPRRFIGAECCLGIPLSLIASPRASRGNGGGRSTMHRWRRRPLECIPGAGNVFRGTHRLIDADIRSEAWGIYY